MKTETAALIVSVVSLLVAGLSLGWQVAQWLLSAARPKAQLMNGVVNGGGAYVGPVGRSGKRLNIQQLRPQGITGPEVIRIQVTNHGQLRPAEWCTDPGERVAAQVDDGHRVILRVISHNRLEEGHHDDRQAQYRPRPSARGTAGPGVA